MHRRPSRTRACTLLAAVALAASACSSAGADKAGGTRAKPPVLLTLADHLHGPDRVQFWTEEIQRRAGGSLRLQVTNHWRDQEFAFDEATIADVQAWRVQLAKVNARAYDIGRREQLPGAAGAVPDRQPDPGPTRAGKRPGGRDAGGDSKLGLVGLAMLPTDRATAGPVASAGGSQGYRAPAWASERGRSPRRPSPPRRHPPSVSRRRTAPEARQSRTRSERDQLERV